jgi:hypothetical protein
MPSPAIEWLYTIKRASPDIARACWFHNRGIKGATVINYCKPLIKMSMGSAGTLEEWKSKVFLKGTKCYQNTFAQVAIIYLNITYIFMHPG